MTEAVLDASALVAFIRGEPGSDRVERVITSASISAVNYSETLAKLVEYGKPLDLVAGQIARLRIPVIPFDSELAHIAASLRSLTRHAGLSLGDRACLALGLSRCQPVFTTDRAWVQLDLGVRIECIR